MLQSRRQCVTDVSQEEYRALVEDLWNPDLLGR